MTGKRVIFWDGTKAIVHPDFISMDAVPKQYLGLVCVDEYGHTPNTTYGYYDTYRSWNVRPYRTFPEAFRLALMLLDHHEVK